MWSRNTLILIGENMKEKYNTTFELLAAPYREEDTDSLGMQWQRYSMDSHRIKQINGRDYYKIIQSLIWKQKPTKLLVILGNEKMLRVGDVLTDEFGREFEITGFELFRFVDDTIPDLYSKIIVAVLKGESFDIGEYLTLIER